MKRIHPVYALLLMLAPMVATAELSLEGLKEGAAKAAKVVGDTAKGALDATGEATGKATEA